MTRSGFGDTKMKRKGSGGRGHSYNGRKSCVINELYEKNGFW